MAIGVCLGLAIPGWPGPRAPCVEVLWALVGGDISFFTCAQRLRGPSIFYKLGADLGILHLRPREAINPRSVPAFWPPLRRKLASPRREMTQTPTMGSTFQLGSWKRIQPCSPPMRFNGLILIALRPYLMVRRKSLTRPPCRCSENRATGRAALPCSVPGA